MKCLLFMALLALAVGCNLHVEARKAGLSESGTICARLQNSIGKVNYCELAASYDDVTEQGSGTLLDPYVVCSPYQLNSIANTAALLDKTFKLAADLDMSCISGNHTPIGTFIEPFDGSIDGGGRTILNWRHVDANADYVGLVSYTETVGGVIKDLTIKDATVTGRDNVGILGGYLRGSMVSNVRTSGTVTGVNFVGGLSGRTTVFVQLSHSSAMVQGNTNVGGLVGMAGNQELASSAFSGTVVSIGSYTGGLVGSTAGPIYNSYNAGQVSSAGQIVGGLVGTTSNNIESSYSAGNVTGAFKVGGLAGELTTSSPGLEPVIRHSFNAGGVSASGGSSANVGRLTGPHSGTVVNSYYFSLAPCDADSITAGVQPCGDNATGSRATLSEFYDRANAPLASWDFQGRTTDGTNDFWEARTTGLPVVWNEAPAPFVPPFTGSGHPLDPYLINTVADFNRIGSNARLMGFAYRLTTNLDFNLQTFRQIGGGAALFHGSFDGNARALSNITFSKSNQKAGVFGGILWLGEVRNLRVINADIRTTHQLAGLLAGSSSGTIGRSQSSGVVLAHSILGGLLGHNSGSVEDSSSAANVTPVDAYAVGGLIGTSNGNVRRSFATGAVIGTTHVGGLIGLMNGGILSDSYARGSVSATTTPTPNGTRNAFGGLIGNLRIDATVYNSFSSGSVTGERQTGGFVGRTDALTTMINVFTTSTVTGTTTSAQVGPLVGTNAGVFINAVTLGTATCDADSTTAAVQACNALTNSTAPDVTYFYDVSNSPLDQWDFVNAWDSDAASLPFLR